MKVELRKAAIEQLPVMQRMGSYYVYDMSEYVGGEPGWAFPDTGDYECDDFGAAISKTPRGQSLLHPRGR